jgi:Sulfotransferase family
VVGLPDFFVVGAPKAGTSALHSALDRHPELFMSKVKEPKYFMCDGPPPRRGGPGDAHSYREWIWERSRYEALFDGATPRMLWGESTPFYLASVDALSRIEASVPHAKLIAVLRDPIDRAYSNWAHMWADGLETIPDFLSACAEEEGRIDAGWAPIWRYKSTGLYGKQIQDLYKLFPREQVYLLRYKNLVDNPTEVINGICRFLGVSEDLVYELPASNVGSYVPVSGPNQVIRASIRGGAWVGSFFPPKVWRRVSVPFLWALQRSPEHRPHLTPQERERLLPYFEYDVKLLERETGLDFSDWLAAQGNGTYSVRKSWAPSRRLVSK